MVSIIPQETPADLIGKMMGQSLSENLPRGLQQMAGLQAIDRLQGDIAGANGDISKILPAIARAYTLNPNLERSGIGQIALQNAKVSNAYGPQGQGMPQTLSRGTASQASLPGSQNTTPFATPSPFNIMTPQDMAAESARFAGNVQDVNGYNIRYNQLQQQNAQATEQRQALEAAALKAGVSPADLPRFMVVNSHLDPRNPSEWAQSGIRNFSDVKNTDDQLQRAFIPGIGNALLGQDRESALQALGEPVRRNAARGLEQENRKFLADNYLSPTEIELLYHPQTPQLQKSLKSIPKGLFPAETGTTREEKQRVVNPALRSPTISYEEAMERDPQSLKIMQDQLSNFFLKNVDKNTSLLGIRDSLWKDKDYDWRQIGPAINQAMQQGLKLEPFQERELTTIQTQPPLQSLPDIFKDMSRIPQFIRGNK